jgi:hypothetical protein
MIELNKYLALKGIKKRAFHYKVDQKKIFKHKVGNVTFVIDPKINVSDEAKITLTDEAKKELDALIIEAHSLRTESLRIAKQTLKKTPHNPQITSIVSRIQERLKVWKSKGVALRGYSPQACYKKINDVNLLSRQRRGDLFEVKNNVLSNPDVYKKLEALVLKLYDDDGRKEPSIRMICKRIVMQAKADEEFYELAAIPFSTLYDHAKKIIDRLGAKHKHLLENNYSEFNRKRPYVWGAHTADINFMEYFTMDDHVMEIDGALEYNTITGQWEKKKVYLWTIMEAKTLQKLAYKLKPTSFNSDDIKLLMLEALTNAGRPLKAILMDNGLGSSTKCNQFLDRLKINHDPGPAYEPLHKSVHERSWGFIKNEFCAQWPNYIGGGRSEVRHTSKRLSPEECTFTFNEFSKAFDKYMEGFFQTNIRTRTEYNEKEEISIRDNFTRYYTQTEKQEIESSLLRTSYMEYKVKFFGYQSLVWSGKGLFNPSINNSLHPVLCDRNYLCYYNPLDWSAIDMYAMEDILIQETGEYYLKGTLVATLYNQYGKSSQEKQKLTSTLRKKHTKATRQLTAATVDLGIAENVHAFSDELNEKGQLLDTRKQLSERVSIDITSGVNRALEVTVPDFKKRGRKAVELDEMEFKNETNQLDEMAKEFDV